MTDADGDTLTEIQAAQIPRVDAVGEPAHGMSFVILKAADPDPLTALGRVLKAKYNAAQQRKMLAAGHAMKGPDGEPSYPIGDTADLDDAIHAVGRGGADHDKIRRFVARRAAALGASSKIPDNWAADGSLKPDVKKAASMDPEALDDLADGTVIESGDVVEDAGGLVAPTHAGDPDDVNSPAWEAVDAARARAAVEAVTWLKGILADMLAREETEAVTTGDDADGDNAYDLGEASRALDCALTVLARFAVTEQAEADSRAQEVADQAAALGITKAIEASVEAIAKAGRVLSAANEQSLRAAHAALSEVLGRVPAPAEEAPVGDVTKAAGDAPADDVEKAAVGVNPGAAPTEDPAAASMSADGQTGDPEATGNDSADVPVSVAKAVDVLTKAAMTPDDLRKLAAKFLQAIPDDKVPAAFQELAKLGAAATGDAGDDADTEDTGEGDGAADAAPAAAPAAPEPVAPAPPAPAADDVTAALDSTGEPTGTDVDTVDDEGDITKAKGGIDVEALVKAFKAAVQPLEERQDRDQAAVDEKLAKALAAALSPLEERLVKMEQQPTPSGVMLNGMAPGMRRAVLRGQDAEPEDSLAGIHKTLKEIAAENPHGAAVASGAVAYDLLASRMGRR